MVDSGRRSPELDLGNVAHPYLIITGFVTFDAIVPILPSESLLNAGSTLASQGVLDLGCIIVGGAIVGDSLLYWIARTVGRRIAAEKLEDLTANKKVAAAQEVLGETAPLIIVAGRYVPGLRFVVGATMGLNRYPYPKFLMWSTLGGVLWSAYTCAFSWWIGTKLGDWPIISMLTSALVTFLLLGLLYFPFERRWAEANAPQQASP